MGTSLSKFNSVAKQTKEDPFESLPNGPEYLRMGPHEPMLSTGTITTKDGSKEVRGYDALHHLGT